MVQFVDKDWRMISWEQSYSVAQLVTLWVRIQLERLIVYWNCTMQYIINCNLWNLQLALNVKKFSILLTITWESYCIQFDLDSNNYIHSDNYFDSDNFIDSNNIPNSDRNLIIITSLLWYGMQPHCNIVLLQLLCWRPNLNGITVTLTITLTLTVTLTLTIILTIYHPNYQLFYSNKESNPVYIVITPTLTWKTKYVSCNFNSKNKLDSETFTG